MASFIAGQYPDYFLEQQLAEEVGGLPHYLMAVQRLKIESNSTFGQMLNCNPTLDYVNVAKAGQFDYFSDIALASLSALALLGVALFIFSDQKLQAHPNKLIAVCCICDAYCFCQTVCRYAICGYQLSDWLNWLYAVTC